MGVVRGFLGNWMVVPFAERITMDGEMGLGLDEFRLFT